MARPAAKGPANTPAARRRALEAVVDNVGAGANKEFDRLIYERIRLGIVSALAVNEALTFVDLKGLFDLTDGNLSAHARKLEQAGYVSCRKFFVERTPQTEYRLTAKGRQALERYLDHMDALIRATRQG